MNNCRKNSKEYKTSENKTKEQKVQINLNQLYEFLIESQIVLALRNSIESNYSRNNEEKCQESMEILIKKQIFLEKEQVFNPKTYFGGGCLGKVEINTLNQYFNTMFSNNSQPQKENYLQLNQKSEFADTNKVLQDSQQKNYSNIIPQILTLQQTPKIQANFLKVKSNNKPINERAKTAKLNKQQLLTINSLQNSQKKLKKEKINSAKETKISDCDYGFLSSKKLKEKKNQKIIANSSCNKSQNGLNSLLKSSEIDVTTLLQRKNSQNNQENQKTSKQTGLTQSMKIFTKAIENLPHKKLNLLGDQNHSNRQHNTKRTTQQNKTKNLSIEAQKKKYYIINEYTNEQIKKSACNKLQNQILSEQMNNKSKSISQKKQFKSIEVNEIKQLLLHTNYQSFGEAMKQKNEKGNFLQNILSPKTKSSRKKLTNSFSIQGKLNSSRMHKVLEQDKQKKSKNKIFHHLNQNKDKVTQSTVNINENINQIHSQTNLQFFSTYDSNQYPDEELFEVPISPHIKNKTQKAIYQNEQKILSYRKGNKENQNSLKKQPNGKQKFISNRSHMQQMFNINLQELQKKKKQNFSQYKDSKIKN